MAISATCPNCSARLQLDDAHAGKRIGCPKCKTAFAAPMATAARARASADALVVACPKCAHKVKTSPKAVGKQIRCEQCQTMFAAPGPDAAPAPAAPPAAAEPTEKATPASETTAKGDPPPAAKSKRKSLLTLGIFGTLGAAAFCLLCSCVVGIISWFSFRNEPFHETPRAFRSGTMTKLQRLDNTEGPRSPIRTVLSGKHKLVFFMSEKEGIQVYDFAAKKWLEAHPAQPNAEYVDMDIAPSQDFVFASDRATEKAAEGITKHLVHRFDLANRKWEVCASPVTSVDVYSEKRINAQYVRRTKTGTREFHREPLRIQAIADNRLFAVVQGGIALWKWQPGTAMSEQTHQRTGNINFRDLEYEPRTARVFHEGGLNKAPPVGFKSISGTWIFNGSTSCTPEEQQKLTDGFGQNLHMMRFVLSSDGKRLYRGCAQMAADEPNKLVRAYRPLINAASDDLAFAEREYYNAATGEKAGEYGHNATLAAVSIDGAYFAAFDAADKKVYVYAIEGQK